MENNGNPTLNDTIQPKLPSKIDIYYVRQTYIINTILIGISALVIIVAILTSYSPAQIYIRFSILAAISILNNYFINKLNALISKILTVISPFICIFILPIILHYIQGGMLVWFPYGIMIIGSSCFLIFSWEHERILLTSFLFIFAIAALFFDRFLELRITNQFDLYFIYKENYPYYMLSKIILLTFLYSSFYQYKIALYKYDKRLNELNQELLLTNNTLEIKIKERTEQLAFQNKRIKDLTYSNSHRLRAQIARIMGLKNLIEATDSLEEKQFYYQNINQIIKELDSETEKITDLLAQDYK